MKRVSFLHAADLHLGASFPGLSPQVGNVRRRELMQAVAAIVDICNERQLDLLLLAGDFWEQSCVTKPLVDFVADQFRRIPYTKVVIAPGEKDYYDRDSYYNYPWPGNVHIFQDESPSSLWLPSLNLAIHGVAWTSSRIPLPDWSQLDTGTPGIIMAHGSPEALGLNTAVGNFPYIALGGSHKYQALSEKTYMPGSPEPLAFDEGDQHGVLVGILDAQEALVEFVPLAKRQFITLPVEVARGQSAQEAAGQIYQTLADLEPGKNLFLLHLSGERDWPLRAFQEKLGDLYFCKIVDFCKENRDYDAIKREGGEAVSRFINALEDEPNPVSRQALQYGLDALLGRRVELWSE